MRITKNKNLSEKTEEPTCINPVFDRIAGRIEAIAAVNPSEQEICRKEIEKCQDAETLAAQAKEVAETEADFNKACDDEAHARERKQFFIRRLEKLSNTPAMDPDEYDEAVSDIDAVIKSSAEELKTLMNETIQVITKAKAEYLHTVHIADKLLNDLDNAANVLQCRYPCRVIKYEGRPNVKVKDPNEWKRHALRYAGTGRACNYVVNAGEPNGCESVGKRYRAWLLAGENEME